MEPCSGHGPPIEYWSEASLRSESSTLIAKPSMMVSVASFTFRFVTIRQIEDCLNYSEQKTHPSSRLGVGRMDHWEAQRWFERLPMYLLEQPKRAKVLKALKRALALAESGAFSPSKPRGDRL